MAETREITVGGEVLTYTRRRRLHELVEFEDATGQRFGEWEADLAAGSGHALCVFLWDLFRQNGRDVQLEDLLSGKHEIDLRALGFGPWDGETGDGG